MQFALTTLLNNYRWLGCLLSSLLPCTSYSAAPDYWFSLGGYYSSGDYGADRETFREDTRIYSVPFSLQARQWPWSVKLATSYVKLLSNEVITGGGTERETVTKTEAGVGDTLFTVSHGWLSNTSKTLYSSAWLKIKIPTADEAKDLGSGEFDFEPGFSLSQRANWSPFIRLSFRWRGDSNETNYNHQWKTVIGLSHKLNTQWLLSGFISSRQASTQRGSTATSAYLSFRYQINQVWRVTPYVSYGLATGSPAYAIGWNVNYRLTSGH